MNNLVWNVIYHNRDHHCIDTFNIFDHYSFRSDLRRDTKKCKTKEDFAEKLRSALMYYFWSKYEWEITIGPWPSSNSTTKAIKEDVYWQITNNWDVFLDYVWNERKKL